MRSKTAGAKERPHGEEAQESVSNHEGGRANALTAFHKPYAESKAMAPVAASVLRGFALRATHLGMRRNKDGARNTGGRLCDPLHHEG
ncbi:hypothetical protein CO659_23860 [Rhizobium sp. S9]|nr:hypothetical protein CO659_23860 [Rhizobium sp. S9]